MQSEEKSFGFLSPLSCWFLLLLLPLSTGSDSSNFFSPALSLSLSLSLARSLSIELCLVALWWRKLQGSHFIIAVMIFVSAKQCPFLTPSLKNYI
jgi:hypothetical protein